MNNFKFLILKSLDWYSLTTIDGNGHLILWIDNSAVNDCIDQFLTDLGIISICFVIYK